MKQHLESHRFKTDYMETAMKWWFKRENSDIYGQVTEIPSYHMLCVCLHKDYL